MSAAADSARRPDEGAAGTAAVPHMVPASSDSVAGRVAEETAHDVSEELLPKDALGTQIEALRKQQQALKEHKKRIQKDLKNAVRKKKRLCERARKLTDKDLLAVLMMRKTQREGRGQALAHDDGMGASRPSEPSCGSVVE